MTTREKASWLLVMLSRQSLARGCGFLPVNPGYTGFQRRVAVLRGCFRVIVSGACDASAAE